MQDLGGSGIEYPLEQDVHDRFCELVNEPGDPPNRWHVYLRAQNHLRGGVAYAKMARELRDPTVLIRGVRELLAAACAYTEKNPAGEHPCVEEARVTLLVADRFLGAARDLFADKKRLDATGP